MRNRVNDYIYNKIESLSINCNPECVAVEALVNIQNELNPKVLKKLRDKFSAAGLRFESPRNTHNNGFTAIESLLCWLDEETFDLWIAEYKKIARRRRVFARFKLRLVGLIRKFTNLSYRKDWWFRAGVIGSNLAIAFMGIIWALYNELWFNSISEEPKFYIFAAVTLFLFSIYLAVLIAGWYTLKWLNQERVATVVLANTTDSEGVLIASEMIMDVLFTFQKISIPFELSIYPLLLRYRFIDAKKQNGIEIDYTSTSAANAIHYMNTFAKHRSEIDKYSASIQFQLGRIELVKRKVAERLEVSSRRMCDSYFRFSPSLFAERLHRYRTVLFKLDHDISILSDPNQLTEHESIIKEVSHLNKIKKYLTRSYLRHKTIQVNTTLRNYSTNLLKEPTASGTVQIYSNALQELSYQLAPYSKESTSENIKKRLESNEYLRFWYDVQRTHPDASPHRRLRKIIESINSIPEQNDLYSQVQKHPKALECVVQISTDAHLPMNNINFELGPFIEGTFSGVYEAVNKFVLTSRKNTVESATNKLLEQIDRIPKEQAIYFLFYDYTRVVRDTLKLINKELIERAKERPSLYFVCVMGGTSRVNFARRLMRHELLYESKIKRQRLLSINESELENHSELVNVILPGSTLFHLIATESYDLEFRFSHNSGLEDFEAVREGLGSELYSHRSFLLAETHKMEREGMSEWMADVRRMGELHIYSIDFESHIGN